MVTPLAPLWVGGSGSSLGLLQGTQAAGIHGHVEKVNATRSQRLLVSPEGGDERTYCPGAPVQALSPCHKAKLETESRSHTPPSCKDCVRLHLGETQ